MIEQFLDKAIIIDDQESEVTNLKQCLENNKCYVTYYKPNNSQSNDELSQEVAFKHHNLIFLDLHLNDNTNDISGQISFIRSILEVKIGESFGSYGIILWTNHTDELEEFRAKILKDKDNYTIPLFILSLNKQNYKDDQSVTKLFSDIEKELKNDDSALFAIAWFNFLNQKRNAIISKIYSSIFQDYNERTTRFNAIFNKILQGYVGIDNESFKEYKNKHIELLKLFNELLSSEMNDYPNIESVKNIENLFTKIKTDNNFGDLSAFFHDLFYINYDNTNQNLVIPGSVYLDNDSDEIEQNNSETAESKYTKKQLINSSIKILVEFTPVCDFACNKANQRRLMKGYIIKNDEFESCINNDHGKWLKQASYYKELKRINLNINGKKYTNMTIILDFWNFYSCSKDAVTQKTYLFRLNERILADIQQKFAAHAFRIGVPVIR